MPFSFSFFSFLFFSFLSFFVVPLLFCRSPCSPSLFLFLSFCPFVLSFSVCFFYRLLRFSFRFPWWRIPVTLLFRLGATPPPPAPCESEPCVFSLRAVFCLALLMLIYIIFSSLPPLFRFRFGHRWFLPVFFLWVLCCCLLGFGFCCDSFSILYVS